MPPVPMLPQPSKETTKFKKLTPHTRIPPLAHMHDSRIHLTANVYRIGHFHVVADKSLREPVVLTKMPFQRWNHNRP